MGTNSATTSALPTLNLQEQAADFQRIKWLRTIKITESLLIQWADSFLEFLRTQADCEYIPDVIDHLLTPQDRARCFIPIRTVIGINYHGLFKKWRTLAADYVAAEFVSRNLMPPPIIAAKQHGFITDIMFGSMHIIRILTLARQPLKKLYSSDHVAAAVAAAHGTARRTRMSTIYLLSRSKATSGGGSGIALFMALSDV